MINLVGFVIFELGGFLDGVWELYGFRGFN
jgi:hypothetical protein